ncbi:hypothetical protein [Methanobrevibacter sp.]|uniref:hypothetical protein n=1 Tax=Methanobrevibacter sp. TaxID=66852 RepID=UPI0038905D26
MYKKIFVLSILAIVMIGCAYAADSTDSLNNNTVTISGINFTIPEGFTEDVDGAIVNESESYEGYNYVTNGKSFENENHFLLMSVSEYEQNITEDILEDVGDETTINNVTGRFDDMGFLALFSYIQDDKVVVITADDRSIIEEVLS